MERAVIPDKLCDHIVDICEKGMKPDFEESIDWSSVNLFSPKSTERTFKAKIKPEKEIKSVIQLYLF